jgi:broad specificity phosphatase PhoE
MIQRASIFIVLLSAAACEVSSPAAPPASAASPIEAPAALEAPAPAPKTTICVVRHAHSFKNVTPTPEGMDAAQLDALTPQGQEQAKALGAALAARAPLAIRSSPAGRAKETAVGIAAQQAGAAPIIRTDEALSPLRGSVSWELRQLAASKGEDMMPEDGESLAEGLARAVAALEGAEPGTTLVLVTHGDIAALLLGELEGTPLLARPAKHMLEAGAQRCVTR